MSLEIWLETVLPGFKIVEIKEKRPGVISVRVRSTSGASMWVLPPKTVTVSATDLGFSAGPAKMGLGELVDRIFKGKPL